MVSKHCFKNGLLKYIDNEVLIALPMTNKWILGTVVTLVSTKYDNLIDNLSKNIIVKSLGIVSENGDIDTDALMHALCVNAEKYGTLQIELPIIGTLKFTRTDIDKLKSYISLEGGNVVNESGINEPHPISNI